MNMSEHRFLNPEMSLESVYRVERTFDGESLIETFYSETGLKLVEREVRGIPGSTSSVVKEHYFNADGLAHSSYFLNERSDVEKTSRIPRSNQKKIRPANGSSPQEYHPPGQAAAHVEQMYCLHDACGCGGPLE